MRLAIRIAVVLPQPEGPTSTQISPAATSRLSESTAAESEPAYRLVVSRYSTERACEPPLEVLSPATPAIVYPFRDT